MPRDLNHIRVSEVRPINTAFDGVTEGLLTQLVSVMTNRPEAASFNGGAM